MQGPAKVLGDDRVEKGGGQRIGQGVLVGPCGALNGESRTLGGPKALNRKVVPGTRMLEPPGAEGVGWGSGIGKLWWVEEYHRLKVGIMEERK